MQHLGPTTLTADEQRAILAATAGHPRDHLVFSMALGTGLRLAELVGLDVGDVYGPGGVPKVRVRMRREIAKGGRAADVFLPDRLVAKLKTYWAWRRRVQDAWRGWQIEVGFDRLYPFHCTRHTAATNVCRATRELFLAQRFARHASPLTTTVYTHPRDEELLGRLAGLSC